jgi:peptide/nickel transport system permease protein
VSASSTPLETRSGPLAWIAGGLLTLLAIAALGGPLLSPYAAWERVGPALQPPDLAHWLGTDELGRDVLVRVLEAGRVSLSVGVAAALLAAVVGTGIGMLAGYRGGWVDTVLMRLTDVFLALPVLPVLLILAAVVQQPLSAPDEPAEESFRDWLRLPWVYAVYLVLVLALFGWMGTARLVRAQVLSLRQREFVLAAQACGVGGLRICLRHLLPHCLGPILIATAGAIASNILYESVLSFLGLSIPPPTPTWGGMLSSARVYSYYRAPWLIYCPGLCITLTALAVNMLADVWQAQVDPRQR